MTIKIDMAKFFNTVRPIFGGVLSQKQVEGMNMTIDRFLDEYTDMRWLAYILATEKRETDSKMQPIREYGTPEYFRARYDIAGRNPKLARKLGNLTPGDGVKYCGRGEVQITGRGNYEKFSALLGVDMVENPDLALDPVLSTEIMIKGMVNGLFTGRSLERYFNAGKTDWYFARRTVNGLDHALEIAGNAKVFYKALT